MLDLNSFFLLQSPQKIICEKWKWINLGNVRLFQEEYLCFWIVWSSFCFVFLRQGFSVASEPVLELALVEQAGLELKEIHLPLRPKCWD